MLSFISTFAKENNDSFYSVSKIIDYYNSEKCFSLLGYKVYFKDTIENKYSLDYVSLGVGLSKKISQQKFTLLEKNIYKSIDNDEIFKKLSEYNPYRQIGAIYSNNTKSKVIVVATMPTSIFNLVEDQNLESTKQKPTSITSLKLNNRILYLRAGYTEPDKQSLSWENEGITYIVFQIQNQTISKEEMIEIAENVMTYNNLH